MLPQSLIQNPVITSVVNNEFQIAWPQAAPLINVNFFYTEKSLTETQYFRNNQYPYQQIDNIHATSAAALRNAMLATAIHSFWQVPSDSLSIYREVFGDEDAVISAGSTVIRIEASSDVNSGTYNIKKDFFVDSPAISKCFFTPDGWYDEQNTTNLTSHIRRPYWGLKSKVIISGKYFIKDNDYLIASTTSVNVRTKVNSMEYSTVDTSLQTTTPDVPLYFVKNETPLYPLLEDQKNFDIIWGRVVNGSIVLNVPVFVSKAWDYDKKRYQFTIKIPNRSYPDNWTLECY